MIETDDLNLIVYVIRIRPHVKICRQADLDPNGVYYEAIEHEVNDVLMHHGKGIRITQDLAQAVIYESGKEAQQQSKSLSWLEATLATVHPISRKIFFEASLKGLR